jgi:cytochrome b involved in lipid metabolism
MQELPAMTVAEAARRGFVVIGASVYDVGPFLGEHPGGEEALARWLGRDATAAFARIVDHEEGQAEEAMARLRVARLAAAEPKKTVVKEAKQQHDSTTLYVIAALVAAAVAGLVALLR